jgi:hypothetical protein
MIRALTSVTAFCLLLLSMVACAPSKNSPAGTVTAYASAAQDKDVERMKSMLSAGTLEMLDAVAVATGSTSDELLLKEAAFAPTSIKVREVKTDGESAMVEIYNEVTGAYDMAVPLVKENGQWKIARDAYVRDLLNK